MFKKYRAAFIILSLIIVLFFFSAGIILNEKYFAEHFSADKTIEEPNAVQIKQFQYIMLSVAIIFLINTLLMTFFKRFCWKILRKELTKKIIISSITVIMFLVLFEAALRAIPQNEFGYNLQHIPEYEGYYNFKEEINTSTYYRINSFGLRDKEYDLEKGEAYRIIVLGDSFTFGVGVLEEETFSTLIEENFNKDSEKFEVLNAGVNGFGTLEEGYKLKELMKYEPDMILLAFYQNDYGDNYPRLKYYNGLLQNVLSYFRTYQFIFYRNYQKDILFIGTIPYLKETPEEHKDFWNITFELIDEIKETAEKNNAELIIVYLPSFEEVDEKERERWIKRYEAKKEEIDINRPSNELIRYASQKGIKVINLLPALREKNVNNTLYYAVDRHWNQEGHKVAAEQISKKLINENLIKK